MPTKELDDDGLPVPIYFDKIVFTTEQSEPTKEEHYDDNGALVIQTNPSRAGVPTREGGDDDDGMVVIVFDPDKDVGETVVAAGEETMLP